MIKGFLFDLDGVLTDTAYFQYLAWKRLADELGLRFTEQNNELLKGVTRLRSLEIILELNGKEAVYTADEKAELIDRKNGYYRELLATKLGPENILPGVLPFLREAKARGIRVAVASASRNAATVLEKLDLAKEFDYIADPAKLTRQKPDPEIFLNCAQSLGLRPEECIGFEDAQAGIEAIHAAGMKAVGIHVAVTTQAPDYPLDSTRELAGLMERIL